MTGALRHLGFAGYDRKPWKNRRGTTHDIAMFPPGAGHDDFDLRLALSPIIEDGVFSSFPGIERVITLIEGKGLALEFPDREVLLKPEESLRFDSGLAPIGKPKGGPVKVINVMVRRRSWQIDRCEIVQGASTQVCGTDEKLFWFCLDAGWQFDTDVTTLTAGHYDSVLVTGPASVVTTHSGKARILLTRMKKVVRTAS